MIVESIIENNINFSLFPKTIGIGPIKITPP